MNDDLFAQEIAFAPTIVGAVPAHEALVLGGMGGSALPAMMLAHLWQKKRIDIHRDYGLPAQQLPQTLCVASSYSGNTEETLSFAGEALKRGAPLAALTSGGALLKLAQEKNIPHVVLPAGMQPRDAVLAATKALAALAGAHEVIDELNATAGAPGAAHAQAGAVAEALKDAIPLVYASQRNEALAYVSKITYNETAKVPAFCNVFPELNHNEMQGLDPLGGTAPLLRPLSILMLRDPQDEPRVLKRMEVFETLMRERHARVMSVMLPEGSDAYKCIWAWQLARQAAHLLAAHYGVEADGVPLVEEFKKRLA